MVKAILVLSEKGGEYKFAYDFKVYNFNRCVNNLKVSYLKLLGSWPKESENSFNYLPYKLKIIYINSILPRWCLV